MNSNVLAQLEAVTHDLVISVNGVVHDLRNLPENGTANTDVPDSDLATATARLIGTNDAPPSILPSDMSREAIRGRRAIHTNLTKLQALISKPSDYVQQLAEHVRAYMIVSCDLYIAILHGL